MDHNDMLCLADSYEHKDPAKAAEWYTKAANGGNTTAAYEIALRYQEGVTPVKRDASEAVRWYRKAAESGHRLAMACLGHMYDHGAEGVPADKEEAHHWFAKAAEHGDVWMMNYLGLYYQNIGVADKAFDWFIRASEAGLVEGMYNIARCYEDGFHVPKDPTKAAEWYAKAAKAGTQAGAHDHQIGKITHNDDDDQIGKLEALANAGDDAAMYDLAVIYDYGRNHLSKAIEWYTKAAEKGHCGALIELGRCHLYGDGVPQNANTAIGYFTRAMEAGDDQAMINLYRAYTKLEDHDKAKEWLQKAERAGDPRVLLDGIPVKEGDNARWFAKGVDVGVVSCDHVAKRPRLS